MITNLYTDSNDGFNNHFLQLTEDDIPKEVLANISINSVKIGEMKRINPVLLQSRTTYICCNSLNVKIQNVVKECLNCGELF